MAVEFGFVSVTVSVLVAPCWTVEGVKVFATAGGGSGVTMSVALAGAVFAAALVPKTPPAGIVFVYGFGIALVTLTLTAQFPAAGIVAPLSVMMPAPAFAVKVPPHVSVAFGVAALTRFGG